jgi:cyclophilin family peptidyl-prolyl cis-trans isomerase
MKFDAVVEPEIKNLKYSQNVKEMEMKIKTLILFICWAIFSTGTVLADTTNPRVHVQTTLGLIVIELDSQAAPKTVDNFLQYATSGFYNQTIFHRIIKGFMIQGGGLTPDMNKKKTSASIVNEADNGLKNIRGSIAMARTMNPNSATAQFFINTVDNKNLDFTAKTTQGWGYCVFGHIVEGLETVDKIEKVTTTTRGGRRDVPADPVIIQSVTVE